MTNNLTKMRNMKSMNSAASLFLNEASFVTTPTKFEERKWKLTVVLDSFVTYYNLTIFIFVEVS